MTPKQSAFVTHKLQGFSNRLAVIEAGYSVLGAKQRGTRLMHHPRIRAALLKGGFDLDATQRTATCVFRPTAGRWLSVSPFMPNKVYSDPIEFLTDGMDCTDLPLEMRIRFAKALLPYKHRKVSR